jgi:hypothetical protein
MHLSALTAAAVAALGAVAVLAWMPRGAAARKAPGAAGAAQPEPEPALSR